MASSILTSAKYSAYLANALIDHLELAGVIGA